MASAGSGSEIVALCATAAAVGAIHTLVGPDHYVPFAAMARAGGWSTTKTLRVTAACGVGHVAGSVAIGLFGLGLGTAVRRLEVIEGIRGDAAGWLLIAFGLGLLLRGLTRGCGDRSERHRHLDGTIHRHRCVSSPASDPASAFPPASAPAPGVGTSEWAPWMLFLLFVFGPCEPLVPLLVVPAAEADVLAVAGVVVAFAAATVGTMILAVMAIRSGIGLIGGAGFRRSADGLAGLALLLCGVAVKLGL